MKAAARLLPPGSRLPSVRELTARHRASPVTVQRAITRLAAEGIVDPRPGHGTFVAARGPAATEPSPAASRPPDLAWQEVALAARAGEPARNPEPVAAPPPGVLALTGERLDPSLQPTGALTAALARAGRTEGAWETGPADGLPDLRAWFVRGAGDLLDPDDVIVCPGPQAALAITFRTLAAPGDPVLVESPAPVGALAAARAAGLHPTPVPADGDGVRPDLLADAFARTGARLLHLQPTYADPHGAVLTPHRRAEVLDIVAAAGAFAIEGDTARDLAIDGDAPPPLCADDGDGHVVLVRSLPASAAGLRVGAVAARGTAGSRLRAARLVDDLSVAQPVQLAALELVSSPGWRRHRRELGPALRSRRDALAAAVARELPGARIAAVPAGGLHLWLSLPDGVDDAALAAAALGVGVAVSPGRPSFPGVPPAAYLRLTYAAAPEPDLTEGVRRLASVAPASLRA